MRSQAKTPALTPATSNRVDPCGNAVTDVQFWQAAVGLDKSKDAADDELKAEAEDDGVAVVEAAPLEAEALADADEVGASPPMGAAAGALAFARSSRCNCFLAFFWCSFLGSFCCSNINMDDSET